MKQLLRAFAFVATALVTAAGAKATVMIQVFDSLTPSTFASGSPSTTPVDISGRFSGTVNLLTFDPALGTLNSLTVSTSINGSASAFVIGNQGDAYSGVTAYASYTLKSSASGISQSGFGYADLPPGNGNMSVDGNGPGFSGTAASNSRTVVGTNAFSLSGGSLTTTLTGSQLAPYIGAGGSYSLSFSTGLMHVSGSIPQYDAVGGFADEAVKLTITANYTPTSVAPLSVPDPSSGVPADPASVTVPEPASLAMIGVGLAAAALGRRRRA